MQDSGDEVRYGNDPKEVIFLNIIMSRLNGGVSSHGTDIPSNCWSEESDFGHHHSCQFYAPFGHLNTQSRHASSRLT